MNERKRNERIFSARSNAGASTEVADRRRSVRKPFIAEALVVEVGSGAKLCGRSCDLVAQGFYMDTLNPLPQGTEVLVRLQHGESRIEAAGRVVYRVLGLGMGIAFEDLNAENQSILNRWLSDSRDEGGVFQPSLPPAAAERSPAPTQKETPIVRLVAALRKKGILTENEAADLLKDPSAYDL